MTHITTRLGALPLLCMALMGLPAPADADTGQAGVSAAVRGDVELAGVRGAQAVGHKVVGGEEIYLGDRITSKPDSGMQVLLLDETTFTIGPNSQLTIDKFVYDPQTNAGKLSATVGKGVFRFISGKIAHNEPANMVVRTPVATIGVRGTAVYGRVDDTGAVIALAGPGPDNNTGDRTAGIDVTTPDGTGELRRPGWGIIVTPGKPPVVGELTPQLLQSLINGISPRLPGAQPSQPIGNTGPSIIQATGQTTAMALASISTLRSTSQVTGAAQATSTSTVQDEPKQQVQMKSTTGGNSGSSSSNSSGFSSSSSTGSGIGAHVIAVPTLNIADLTTFAQLASLTSGVGYYTQNNVRIYDASQGSITHQIVGSYTFNMAVDFSSRTVSGTFKNISAPSFGIFNTNNTVNFSSDPSPYAASPGPAIFAGTSPCGGGSAVCTGVAALQNGVAGVPAVAAYHQLEISDGAHAGIGVGKAMRSSTPPGS